MDNIAEEILSRPGHAFPNNNITTMVTAIDNSPTTTSHIYGYDWIFDDDLEDCEKVEAE